MECTQCPCVASVHHPETLHDVNGRFSRYQGCIHAAARLAHLLFFKRHIWKHVRIFNSETAVSILNVVFPCSAFFPQHWLHTGSGASAVCLLQQWTEESTCPCQPNARQAAGQPAGLQWAGTHGAGGKQPCTRLAR